MSDRKGLNMKPKDDFRNSGYEAWSSEVRDPKLRIEAAELQVREIEIQDLAKRISAGEDHLRKVPLAAGS